MIFPRGHALHSNLDSLFIRIDALTSVLKEKNFSGYLGVSSADYEGVLIFYKGRLSAALDDYKGVKGRGKPAIQQIFSKGKEKDCSISVNAMPRNTVAHLLKMGYLRLLYKDLPSAFTDLNNLVNKLMQDGVAGCIDVTALNHQWSGIVFLSPDQMDGGFLWSEGKTTTGSSVLNEIRSLISKTGAVFNVFSAAGKIKQSKRPKINNTPRPEHLIVVWGDIIGTVEKAVQPHVKKGFLFTFKTVLKEISVVYPFLHPISGGFYYENGKASFRGPADRLSEALGKSLSASVSRLAADQRKVNLSVLVKSALQPLIRKHADAMKHFSIASSCELFDMTIYDRVVVAARPFFGENTGGFLERQWLNKISATAENLIPEDLTALVAQLDKSAMLLISKEEVRELCQQIEFIQNSY